MGRKPAIPHADLKELIKKNNVVNEKGIVYGPSHQVWQDMEELPFIGGKLDANYLYVYVKSNRHDIHHEILKDKKIPIPEKSAGILHTVLEEEEDEDEDDEDDGSSKKNFKKNQLKPPTTFNVLIPPEKWLKMKPCETTVRRSDRPNPRVISVLPQYVWEPIVIDCLWDQWKLPCPYSFYRSTVSSAHTRRFFVEMAADCKECGATAIGTILMEPQENEHVTLKWRAHDTRGIPHQKKRWLTHDLRKDVGKMLQGRSASAWRQEEAAKKMDHGDVEPPNLYPPHVIRKSQHEHLVSAYHMECDSTDAVQNLQKMKTREPFANSIHQIGLDPFFMFYHTEAQIHVLRTFTATNHVVLALDATGSLVQKVPTANGLKSPHIFLYEGVIKAGDQQVPVMQMLSARQDANIISFWILDYIRYGAPAPHEVVVDHSWALINAVVISFCGCTSLQDYYSRLFYIVSQADIPKAQLRRILPQSYLRLDIAHLIGGAAKWKEWKDKATKRHKLFYMQCLGLLVLESTLDGFQDTFIMVGCVADSQYCSEDVRSSVQALTERIQGDNSELNGLIGEVSSQEEDDEDNDFEDLDPSTDEDLMTFLDNIKDKIASQCEDNFIEEPNAYYSPDVMKRFYKLLPDFLLWTGVLVSTFKSPTAYGSSAGVESYFNILKNGILPTRRTLRLDKFVAMHIQHLHGACHISQAKTQLVNAKENGNDESEGESEASGESDVKKSSKRKLETDEDFDTDSETDQQKALNTSENWKNKGEVDTPKKSKISKYLNPCPELSVVMAANSLQPPKATLLRNGLHVGFLRTSATSHAQLQNTCAFDVLAQLITSAYIQYGVYRESVQPYLNDDLLKTCISLAEKGAVQETYLLRLDTLSKVTTPATVKAPKRNILRSRKSSVAITYDCFADLIDLSRELLKNIFSVSVTSKCSLKRFRPCTPLTQHYVVNADVEVLLMEGIEKLDKAVLVSLRMMDHSSETHQAANPHSTTCLQPCDGLATISCTFGPHLFINVDIFGTSDIMPNPRKCTLRIQDVPTKLQLLGTNFVLCGIGARTSSHYVAYTRKAIGHWELYNDLDKKVKGVRESAEVQPVLLLYVALPIPNP